MESLPSLVAHRSFSSLDLCADCSKADNQYSAIESTEEGDGEGYSSEDVSEVTCPHVRNVPGLYLPCESEHHAHVAGREIFEARSSGVLPYPSICNAWSTIIFVTVLFVEFFVSCIKVSHNHRNRVFARSVTSVRVGLDSSMPFCEFAKLRAVTPSQALPRFSYHR